MLKSYCFRPTSNDHRFRAVLQHLLHSRWLAADALRNQPRLDLICDHDRWLDQVIEYVVYIGPLDELEI